MPVPNRFVGITVMPEFIQAEGIDRVIANLKDKAGATAVATSPNVVEEADAKTGSREPPIDAGAGKVRLLDRPLWGKRELFVRSEPAFEPHLSLYGGLRYQPPRPGELTRRHGKTIADFVSAARRAGLAVYFQVQAASPPGYRVQFGGPLGDDTPLLPDGRVPPRRVANNASLASPDVRAYNQALTRDPSSRLPGNRRPAGGLARVPPVFPGRCVSGLFGAGEVRRPTARVRLRGDAAGGVGSLPNFKRTFE